MNRDKKIILLAATVVAGVVGTLVVLPPVRQDPTYHRFADQRTWAGIPHAGDVLSNLSFVIVALLGLAALFMYARRDHGTARIWTTPYTAFFIGIALIGAGSSYYHWAPDNAALVWDRLPMTLTFMSLFCAVIADRMGLTIGKELFVPLLLIGSGSVAYWSFTGDLRAYGLVQFMPVILLPLVCWMFPPRRGLRGPYLGGLLGLYGLAKVLEYYDHEVWNVLGHTVSGHTLKHVFAAAACAVVAWFMVQMSSGRHAVHTARH